MRFISRKFIFLFAIVLAAFGSIANADVLLNYDFTGSPGNQVFEAPDFQHAMITGGNLTRGGTIGAIAGANSINSNGWETGNTRASFYEFSISPNASAASISLSKMSFRERRSGTGIRFFEILTSTNGGTTFNLQAQVSVPDDTLDRDHAINLTGLSNVTNPVIFRIFGSSSEGFGGTWRLQNHPTTNGLTIEGSFIAVPEPTAFGVLFALGTVGLTLTRRNRK